MHSQAADLTYTKYKEDKKWGCLSERIYLHTESKVQVYLHVIQPPAWDKISRYC